MFALAKCLVSCGATVPTERKQRATRNNLKQNTGEGK